MKKILPHFILSLLLFSLVSCTLTKRKYTGGFYVNWHKKVPEVIRPQPIVTSAIRPHPTLSYEERVKSRPPEKSKPCLQPNTISETYKNITPPCVPIGKEEQLKVHETKSIPCNQATTSNNQIASLSNEGSLGASASDKRFLDNGLTGFEAAVVNLLVLGLLILFLHLSYGVFIVGCTLLIIAFSIYSLVYCFKGLNSNDKHRGLALAGLFIDIGVIITFCVLAL